MSESTNMQPQKRSAHSRYTPENCGALDSKFVYVRGDEVDGDGKTEFYFAHVVGFRNDAQTNRTQLKVNWLYKLKDIDDDTRKKSDCGDEYEVFYSFHKDYIEPETIDKTVKITVSLSGKCGRERIYLWRIYCGEGVYNGVHPITYTDFKVRYR